MPLTSRDLSLRNLPRLNDHLSPPVEIAQISRVAEAGRDVPSIITEVVYCSGIIERDGKDCLVYSNKRDNEDGVLHEPIIDSLDTFHSYSPIDGKFTF